MLLVKYEQARQALAEVRNIDEAKGIVDKVAALQAYAKQQNDQDMEMWLSEIKLRARRRIGEISSKLDKAHKAGQGSEVQLPSAGKLKTEVLKQAGLSTSVAQRCETIAGIPIEKFEERIAEIKVRAARRIGEITKEIEKAKPGVKSELSTPSGLNKQQVLKNAGISKQEASRCERIASLPEGVLSGLVCLSLLAVDR